VPGISHEKTQPGIAEKIHNALTPPDDEWARQDLYRRDEVTSWFGGYLTIMCEEQGPSCLTKLLL